MMTTDISFKIGGEAGQGLQSIGYGLARALAKGGLYIFAIQDNESRIRGGHNFFQVRVSDKPIQALSERIHVLISLNTVSIEAHQQELVEDGVIIYDAEKVKAAFPTRDMLGIPFEKLAKEKTGLAIAANSVAVGAALSLVGYDFNFLAGVLEETFGKKGAGIVQKNIEAARTGYDYVPQNLSKKFKYTVTALERSSERLLLTGNDAIASGALISSCKFMSGYPMSPSTPIQQFFASKMRDYNVVFEQAEDEISAINMALGASFAGVRSMAATSGGGFSLMVEGVSLAGMTETPVVIVIAQRPGPATGFPTRTEQAELEFAIHAGHGEFPRAVFAPGNAEQAFYLTSKAFNLAEKYQIPVIILSDQHLSDSYFATEEFDISRIAIDRGTFYTKENAEVYGEYKRHLITDSGISPRLFPGEPLGLVVTDSDEHTEEGHITERAEDRVQNVKKRLKKLELVKREIADPYAFGPADAEIVLIGWGSTFGALTEAVETLNAQRVKVKMLHLSEVWPFPAEAFVKEATRARHLISVESNATGQMAHLIRAETGTHITSEILRFDGRPISPEYILREFARLG